MWKLTLFLLCVLIAIPCRGRTITVSKGGLTDSNSIQAAIDAASDGDVVIAAEGTYSEDLNFKGKSIILTSTNPANSRVVKDTIISGSVRFRGTEGPSCAFTGFNVDGFITGFDWQIDPKGENHTRATISHCVLENIMTGCGGVIQACDGTISNCIIASTSYMCLRPWPVPAIVGCHGLITNCTFVRMSDGIEVLPGGECTIRNCTTYGGSAIIVHSGATVNVSYCDFQGGRDNIFGAGTVNWGPGNIDMAPCFGELGSWQVTGDYHLKSQVGRWDAISQRWVQDDVSSPCIDAGDPNSDWAGELWPHGKRINMGAYSGTAQASMSLSSIGNVADLNNDGSVDHRDMTILTNGWPRQGILLREDLDRNGWVGFVDFCILADNWLWQE